MSKVIVIGGGPAGMMAAIAAADAGHTVTLLEKNEKLGKKLYITGKGRCNVTNQSDVESMLSKICHNAKFLYSAFYCFDSEGVMDFFDGEGLALKTERGNRVFPVSDKSSDVIRTLSDALHHRGVQVLLHTEVIRLLYAWEKAGLSQQTSALQNREKTEISQVDTLKEEKTGVVTGVEIKQKGVKRKIVADAVIIATGGLSYPSTGSTGAGYTFAKESGHKITPCYPALVPINIKEEYVKALQGLSLRNVTLQITQQNKIIFDAQGELLFTHFGISGPLALSASSFLGGYDMHSLSMTIDLKPALSIQQLDKRLLRDFETASNSYFRNSLGKLLPAKLQPIMVQLSEIPPEKPVNAITKAERKRLLALLKGFPLTPEGLRGYNEAIITRGGVSVKDVNPATMASKYCKGLSFAGEVLDLDAVTGGYNLQIAWSTGYLAGISIK